MKVLVTGANGFLGSHIVRTLIKDNYKVKAFLLNGTSKNPLTGLDYELFEGDLLQKEDIKSATKGCDIVIHAAAITDVWPTKNEISWEVNYDVVKTLVEVIKENNIKKYIHIGTANSFGFGTLDAPGTEESIFNSGKYGLDYIDSKKAAQDYLLQEEKENNLPVVIINPTFMIGENDAKPGTGEMIINVINGKIPGYTKGGRCFASVKDVAKLVVTAIEKGKIGECYIGGGVNLCYKDFFEQIAKIVHVKPPKIKLPRWCSILFGAMLEFFSLFTNKKPKLSIAMAKIASDGNYYSSEKAKKELGYPQTDLETALTEAIAYYKNEGLL